jgi:hypothetical protein
LFAVGSTIERHQHHAEPASTGTISSGESGTSGESGSEGSAGEAGDGSQPAESPGHAEPGSREAEATILGVNTESVAVSAIAVVASSLLALLVWLGRWPRVALPFIAVFGLVFAAGDGRELVHQLDESNAGLAAIAAILVGLHLGVTALAVGLFPHRSNSGELAASGRLL